jgi:curved DNA-binding protein CbpA
VKIPENMKDYYKILGLKETASAEEIRDRWIELMQKFHPDHASRGAADEEIAKEVNEAYQVLKYSSDRMEYDFERLQQRSIKKFSFRKLILPISGLTLLLIISFIYFKGPQVVSTQTNMKPKLPPSYKAEGQSIPNYEPSPGINFSQTISEPKPMVKVEKKGQEKEVKPIISKRNLEPKILEIQSKTLANPPSFSPPNEPKPSIPLNNKSYIKPVKTLAKISNVHIPADHKPPTKVEDEITEPKPPSSFATEEEVRQFFDNYIERYTQKDIHSFLSLFSSKAIQNQKDGLEGIRRIYGNFFNQSQELQYQMKDIKIEIYQNAVKVKARSEADQILKKGGEKKIWKWDVFWILVKEEGVLRIVSLDYKHLNTP